MKEDLNKYNFGTSTGFYSKILRVTYKTLSEYFNGSSCLELGCADGEGTKILAEYFDRVLAVDGSIRQLNLAKKRVKNMNVEFLHSYFEKLSIKEKFDTIMIAHVLEHVDDPIAILKKAKKLMKRDGVLIIDVPNANSIHRQVGVLMGLLKDAHELNESDRSVGHKRVYDLQSLLKDINASGLSVVNTGGVFIKSLSNDQLEKILSAKGVEAFGILGKKYPDISAEIYVICEL